MFLKYPYETQVDSKTEHWFLFPDVAEIGFKYDPAELSFEPYVKGSRVLNDWIRDRLSAGLQVPRPGKIYYGNSIRISYSLSFVTLLRWKRAELGLTQAQVANLLGVRQQTYARLETVGANPRLSTIQALDNVGVHLF